MLEEQVLRILSALSDEELRNFVDGVDESRSEMIDWVLNYCVEFDFEPELVPKILKKLTDEEICALARSNDVCGRNFWHPNHCVREEAEYFLIHILSGDIYFNFYENSREGDYSEKEEFVSSLSKEDLIKMLLEQENLTLDTEFDYGPLRNNTRGYLGNLLLYVYTDWKHEGYASAHNTHDSV